MKISQKLTIAGVAIVVILGAAIVYSNIPQLTNIQTVDAAVIYNYAGTNIKEPLQNEEALILYNIFNRKTLTSKTPPGEFSPNVAIGFREMIFCIPIDGSLSVKLQNRNKYFTISADDRKVIVGIFNRHGAEFPEA
ncbi:MAG: hypothetical protein WCN92_01185 [Eubacteriales bacterium]